MKTTTYAKIVTDKDGRFVASIKVKQGSRKDDPVKRAQQTFRVIMGIIDHF